MPEVTGNIVGGPMFFIQAGIETMVVGNGGNKIAAFFQQGIDLSEVGVQVIHVFQDMPHGDDIGPGIFQLEEAFRIRSEEHTSELQSLMRISYAVFCLKKKKNTHSKLKLQYQIR